MSGFFIDRGILTYFVCAVDVLTLIVVLTSTALASRQPCSVDARSLKHPCRKAAQVCLATAITVALCVASHQRRHADETNIVARIITCAAWLAITGTWAVQLTCTIAIRRRTTNHRSYEGLDSSQRTSPAVSSGTDADVPVRQRPNVSVRHASFNVVLLTLMAVGLTSRGFAFASNNLTPCDVTEMATTASLLTAIVALMVVTCSLSATQCGCSWLSRLFVLWSNEIVARGWSESLDAPADALPLPASLTDVMPLSRDHTLSANLLRRFRGAFVSVGLLRLAADLCGFASPLALHALIDAIDMGVDKASVSYVAGCCVSLVVAASGMALLNVHFNLGMSVLSLRVRSTLMLTTYGRSLDTGGRLELDVGRAVNLLTTDCDRVVNFAPSVHALWSLPLQFIVTCFLLYKQVGWASMFGVVIMLLLIPLNRAVATAIQVPHRQLHRASARMMDAKDGRMRLMTFVLRSMRNIKLLTWEDYFIDRINMHRNVELQHLARRKYLDAVCVYLWATTPVLISVATFSICFATGLDLSPAAVFTAVALFAMLSGPLNAFPWAVNGVVEAVVSLRRMRDFWDAAGETVTAEPSEDSDASANECVFDGISVTGDSAFSVSNDASHFHITVDNQMELRRHQCLGITGPVGSGKTMLLHAVIPAIPTTAAITRCGRCSLAPWSLSRIAHVPQTPWLISGSVRDNVLFGAPYDEAWYATVINACALTHDLVDRDLHALTDVGENGCRLSGGQRTRVVLARAVYSRRFGKDVFVFDDIFASLDRQVADHVMTECVVRLLLGRATVVMATSEYHAPYLTKACDRIWLIDSVTAAANEPARNIVSEVASDAYQCRALSWSHSADHVDVQKAVGVSSAAGSSNIATALASTVEEREDTESSERGVVKTRVWRLYLDSIGRRLCVAVIVAMVVMQATRNATDVYLAHVTTTPQSADGPYSSRFLSVYGGLAVANTVATVVRAVLFAHGGLVAAKRVHSQMLHRIIRATCTFFDGHPMARVVNRFSSDLYSVDDALPFSFNILLAQLFGLVFPLAACVYAVPIAAAPLILLTFVYIYVQLRYRATSRQLQRINAVSQTPLYAAATQTLHPAALATIVTYQRGRQFYDRFSDLLNANQRARYSTIVAAQWLDVRLQGVGCLFLGAICTSIAGQWWLHHLSHNANTSGATVVVTVKAGFVGLALSYALGVVAKLADVVRAFAETERELVAVERCAEYINEVGGGGIIDVENIDSLCETGVIQGDSLTVSHVSMAYGNMDSAARYAFQDLSFDLRKDNGRVMAVVGRTGSGKSSIFSMLTRLYPIVESSAASIMLDDHVDVTQLPVRELRRSIFAVMCQQPFLAIGASVRANIDPLNEHTDAQIEAVLADVWPVTLPLRLDLDRVLDASDLSALSVGEQQFICLARILLSGAKIICIDEATACLDAEAETAVYALLRRYHSDKLIMIISHRPAVRQQVVHGKDENVLSMDVTSVCPSIITSTISSHLS